MSEKIHLYAGIFRIHRFEAEFFGPYDTDLTVIIWGVFFLKKFLFEISALLVFCDQLGLVLAKLTLDNLFDQVNGYIHIITFLFGADNSAFDRDRNFDFLTLSLNA